MHDKIPSFVFRYTLDLVPGLSFIWRSQDVTAGVLIKHNLEVKRKSAVHIIEIDVSMMINRRSDVREREERQRREWCCCGGKDSSKRPTGESGK